MSQCIARTKDFERCRNHTEPLSLFCRRHRWWWLITLFGAIVAVTTIGSNVATMFGTTFPNPLSATPTPTAIITVTSTFAATPSETPSLAPNEIVFFDVNIYHIGDTIEWSPLVGKCKNFDFVVKLPVRDASLNVEIYDADDNALIKINGTMTSTIPISSGDETWSESKFIPLPANLFTDGRNSLEFCSVMGHEGMGLDDFQIRNIRVEINR